MSKFGQAELDLEDKEELFDLVFRMIYFREVNTAVNTVAGGFAMNFSRECKAIM